MPKPEVSTVTPQPARSRVGRWLLAAAGVMCVGLGALGVVVPGLPTTIFLIVASWCFARSCPWLEDRLVRTPFFRPFIGYLDGARMPLRAVVVTLLVMWTAITVSTAVLLLGDRSQPLVAAIVVAAGLIGTVFVVRLRGKDHTAVPRPERHGADPDWPEGQPLPVEAEESQRRTA